MSSSVSVATTKSLRAELEFWVASISLVESSDSSLDSPPT